MSGTLLVLAFAGILVIANLLDDYVVGGPSAVRRHAPVVVSLLGAAVIISIAIISMRTSADRPATNLILLVFLIANIATRFRAPVGGVTTRRLLLLAATVVALGAAFYGLNPG